MPKDVYVMLYSHQYGTDCSVFETEEDAHGTIRKLIQDSLKDYSASRHKAIIAKISKHLQKNFAGGAEIVDDDPDTAAAELWSLWTEMTDESFSVERCTIIPKGGVHE